MLAIEAGNTGDLPWRRVLSARDVTSRLSLRKAQLTVVGSLLVIAIAWLALSCPRAGSFWSRGETPGSVP